MAESVEMASHQALKLYELLNLVWVKKLLPTPDNNAYHSFDELGSCDTQFTSVVNTLWEDICQKLPISNGRLCAKSRAR